MYTVVINNTGKVGYQHLNFNQERGNWNNRAAFGSRADCDVQSVSKLP